MHTLKSIIQPLLETYQPIAERQNSSFVAEIPDNLKPHGDQAAISALLNSLLYVCARCSRNTRLYLTAIVHGDMIILSIKDPSSANNYSHIKSLVRPEIFADRINGMIEMNSGKDSATDILFHMHGVAILN